MKIKLLQALTLFLSLFLFSCVTNQVITGPDGTPHQLIYCGYISSCYEQATEICGGKYKIVNTSNRVSGDENSTSSSSELLVKCQK